LTKGGGSRYERKGWGKCKVVGLSPRPEIRREKTFDKPNKAGTNLGFVWRRISESYAVLRLNPFPKEGERSVNDGYRPNYLQVKGVKTTVRVGRTYRSLRKD